jgi:hypothetical protein
MYVAVVSFSKEELQIHDSEDNRSAFLSVNTFRIQKLPLKLVHEWYVVRNFRRTYFKSVSVFS